MFFLSIPPLCCHPFPHYAAYLSCSVSLFPFFFLFNKIKFSLFFLLIQIQSNVDQPPLTEEHKQRVGGMMASLGLQTPSESCSASLPGNVLYPSSVKWNTLINTLWTVQNTHRLTYFIYNHTKLTHTHTLSPPWKLLILYFKRQQGIFMDFLLQFIDLLCFSLNLFDSTPYNTGSLLYFSQNQYLKAQYICCADWLSCSPTHSYLLSLFSLMLALLPAVI